MLNREQLEIQRLVTHYNTYGTKTNSARNNELLDILLSIGSNRDDLEIIEEKGEQICLMVKY